MGYEDTDEGVGEDVDPPERCEHCGEEMLRRLEECPVCGRFLCEICIGAHSCDDPDLPPEDEEDDDDRF